MRISTLYYKIRTNQTITLWRLISQVNLCILVRMLDGLFNLLEFYMAKHIYIILKSGSQLS